MTSKKNPAEKIIILFIKAPVPGQAKTRLMPHLSGGECAELYSRFVKDLVKNVAAFTDTKILVAYQPHAKFPDVSWTGKKPLLEFFPQEGKSLGERLTHATGLAFGRGAKRVVIIGSDSPNLPMAFIEQAFTALKGADLAVGPAMDGGYYLIGLSRPALKLFEDLSWSTDQVFERTTKNAEKQGYSLRVLPVHYDVDTLQDLQRLHRDLTSHPTAAPLTLKYLTALLKTTALFAN